MIHMNTYQNAIIQKYSKLGCLLELDTATANHLHREAFSNSEVALAKEKLTKLQDLQCKLNGIWKTVRWLMDVISFARDRMLTGNGCILLICRKKSNWICWRRSSSKTHIGKGARTDHSPFKALLAPNSDLWHEGFQKYSWSGFVAWAWGEFQWPKCVAFERRVQ